MAQLLAALIVGAIVLFAISLVLFVLFWPFIMAQDYFLFEHGIDKYSLPAIIVGVIAQLIYIGAAVTALWIAVTWKSAETVVVPTEQETAMPVTKGTFARSPAAKPTADWTGNAIGTCVFLGVCLLIYGFLYSDLSPEQRLERFEEKCVEEVAADHPTEPGQPRRVDLIDLCVEHKLDQM